MASPTGSAQVVELWSIANAKRKAAMAKEKTPAASKTSGVTRAEIADGTVVLQCPIIMLRCHIKIPYYNTAMPDHNALLYTPVDREKISTTFGQLQRKRSTIEVEIPEGRVD